MDLVVSLVAKDNNLVREHVRNHLRPNFALEHLSEHVSAVKKDVSKVRLFVIKSL